MRVSRRGFLAAGAAGVVHETFSQTAAIPILDTHIHLFDTERPQGVPWPSKDNAVLYKRALPDRFRSITTPLGIVGAIAVEASPWIEDNLWLLDAADKDPIIVGVIGNLDPGKPEFPEYLDRFRRHPLFRGIRYGNLWARNLGAELAKPEFVSGLKALAAADLTLDTANPRPDLIEAVVRLTDRIPELRVVIDHVPQLDPPSEPAA